MQVIYRENINTTHGIFNQNTDDLLRHDGCAVGLGSFDGLHIGHITLIKKLIEASEKYNLSSAIYTFRNHPSDVLQKNKPVSLLMTEKEKLAALESQNIDITVADDFNEKIANISPEAFIDWLCTVFKAKILIIGYDYTFGKNGAGNADTLRKYAGLYGYDVIEIPPVKMDGDTVSSTKIRNMLENGNVSKAAAYLGKNYFLSGRVEGGHRLGRTIGFPTANVCLPQEKVIPGIGVYATLTEVMGNVYKSITNIGRAPTVNTNAPVLLETHILNFNDVIYDKKVTVEFLLKLRDEQKFAEISDLKKQLENDKTVRANMDR